MKLVANDAGVIRARVSTGKASDDATYTAEWNSLTGATAYGPAFSYAPAYPAHMFPLEAGKTWRNETVASDPASGRKIPLKIHARIVGPERVKVPAGEFDTVRIERLVYAGDAEWWRSATRIREIEWYAAAVQRAVRKQWDSEYHDQTRTDDPLVLGDRIVLELVSYRPVTPSASR